MTIARVYTNGLAALAAKKIDFLNDTVVCCLLTATYVPNQDTHAHLSDLTNELAGGGYARVNLSSKTAVQTAGTLTLSCADVEFASLTADPGPRYAVFAVNTGVSTTSPLLCWMDFETATAIAAQTAKVTIPATGLLRYVAA